jgi:hypothetical protein
MGHRGEWHGPRQNLSAYIIVESSPAQRTGQALSYFHSHQQSCGRGPHPEKYRDLNRQTDPSSHVEVVAVLDLILHDARRTALRRKGAQFPRCRSARRCAVFRGLSISSRSRARGSFTSQHGSRFGAVFDEHTHALSRPPARTPCDLVTDHHSVSVTCPAGDFHPDPRLLLCIRLLRAHSSLWCLAEKPLGSAHLNSGICACHFAMQDCARAWSRSNFLADICDSCHHFMCSISAFANAVRLDAARAPCLARTRSLTALCVSNPRAIDRARWDGKGCAHGAREQGCRVWGHRYALTGEK